MISVRLLNQLAGCLSAIWAWQKYLTLQFSQKLFTTFSCCCILIHGCCHDLPCLNEFTGDVLSSFKLSRRPVEQKSYSGGHEDSLRPLLKAIVYSRLWVRKSVNKCDKCKTFAWRYLLTEFHLFIPLSLTLTYFKVTAASVSFI